MKIFKTKTTQKKSTEIAPFYGEVESNPSVDANDPRIIATRAGLKGEHYDRAVAFLEEADRIADETQAKKIGSSATEQVAEIKIVPVDHQLDRHSVEAIASALNDASLNN